MPKVTDEHALARRQQIIDAAYRCFARKGFHQTTMRDIYEEAQLSPGAVYHYFESKHDIIAASFNFDYERSISLFTAARASDDPLGALKDLLGFLFDGLKGASALGASRVNVQGWGEALINPSLLETVRRTLNIYRDATTQIIRRAQSRGQIDREADPGALANALISLYYGLELQLALEPDLDVEKYAEVARALLKPDLRPA
ncbi:MAG TPA: TetR/AcrR family transcriptional regulator [Anaerolineae bacterium]